jgi:methyl-accepting chemotaxis protein
MKFLNNIKTGVKLYLGFGLELLLIIVLSVFGIVYLSKMNTEIKSMYTDSTVPIQQLGTIESEVFRMRGDAFKYVLLPEERTTSLSNITTSKKTIEDTINAYKNTDLSAEERAGVKTFDTTYAEYIKDIDNYIALTDAGKAEEAKALIVDGGAVANSRKDLGTAITSLVELNVNSAKDSSAAGEKSYQSSLYVNLGLLGLALLLSLFMSISLTANINKPLSIVTEALNILKTGSVRSKIDEKTRNDLLARKDEFGALTESVVETRKYFIEMSNVATKISENDLTVAVKPKGDDDQLGNAFKKMSDNLRSAVSQVADASTRVSTTSNELAIASNQAGQATSQIATTIQQVARGTTQQSEAINRTASSVEEMGRAIDGVASGAQEQAGAASKASTLTGQLSAAIEQVAGNAEAVVRDSSKASDAARRGAQTVDQTLAGMQSIRSAVGLSAQKVQEMGSRSDQIGSIVTTIEDIASQTNLLALNAAIEAARAGEAGKGFAVVADEVRKLAERSSASTKEISDLIKGIQKTVAEAVTAMGQGAKEVESGVTLANQAGSALKEILSAADEVKVQAEQAAGAAERMSVSANELVSAVDSVSAVVEENTAATEEMAASSTEVTQAIENIASVSEENSAAVEEVSASAEEMTAQVEEVSASAQELASLAEMLKNVVAQFKLS